MLLNVEYKGNTCVKGHKESTKFQLNYKNNQPKW